MLSVRIAAMTRSISNALSRIPSGSSLTGSASAAQGGARATARLGATMRHLSGSASGEAGTSTVSASGIARITVFGGGLMGAGIAQVAAHNGFKVTLCDVSEKALDNGRAIIQKSIARIAKRTHPTDEAAQKELVAHVFDNIATTTDAESAVSSPSGDADLVIEAIIEDLKIKQKLFAQLDQVAKPACIFATNTSSLSVTEIASSTSEERRRRFGGLHFFNPVPQMKLVEVVKTEETSQETYESLMEVCARLHKRAVTSKDTPGFIVNRLLVPYMAEAVRMLERGDATAEDIDAAMRLGAGHPMGPIELTDFVGLDTTKHILDGWREKADQGDRSIPRELLSESTLLNTKVAEGKLGHKTGEGFLKH